MTRPISRVNSVDSEKKKKKINRFWNPSQQESTFLEKSGVKIFHLWCDAGAATVTERRLNNPHSEFGSKEELCVVKKIGFDGTIGRTNVVSVHGGGQDRRRERWPWRFHSLQIALSAFSGGKIGEDRSLILCGSAPWHIFTGSAHQIRPSPSSIHKSLWSMYFYIKK